MKDMLIIENKIEQKVEYRMSSSVGHVDVVVMIDAEIGGHGTLHQINLPPAISSRSFGGQDKPEIREVMHVLNRIFKDYHCGLSIITGERI